MPRQEVDWSAYTNAAPAVGAIPFSAFAEAMRQAGLAGNDWVKAKRAGAIVVEHDETGVLVVSRPVTEGGG